MKSQHYPCFALVLAFLCCGPQRQAQEAVNNSSSPVLPAPSAPPAVGKSASASAAPKSNATATAPAVSVETNRGAPLVEPTGPIDPKSAEAAGQVVQHYGALIEQKRFDRAARLWGNADDAANFRLQLRRYPDVHLAIGKPGDMEGAAGSSYVTVPAAFYGTDQNGAQFRRSAAIILRRVNDVPGSTEAQRRWHIERIDWEKSA
jgi:hypothetical protein